MATSVHGQILAALVSALQGATSLSGISDANIVQQSVPTDKSPLPAGASSGIVVAPWGAERIDAGPLKPTNTAEVIGYPQLVCYLVVRNQTHSDSNLDTDLLVREKIIDLLIHTRPTVSATGVIVCDVTVEPLAIADASAWWDRQLFLSPLQVIVWCKKTRRA